MTNSKKMAKQCWYCERTNQEIADNFFGDFFCKFCNVLNSIYNPAAYVPLTEEEKVLNYQDEKYQGKFVYLPKVGEEAVFEIKELREVKGDNPKFNFSENVPVMINGEQAIDDEGEQIFKKKDLGYHIEAELVGGKILSVSSLSAFIQVFKKNAINDGDKVRVKHTDKGVWEVEKL